MRYKDPITLEVLRNALQAVAEEMGVILTRTAFSPNIKDRRDCSTAIYTPDGRLVAQAEHIPLHLGLMPSVVKAVLEKYPITRMEPKDAIIINDPYISGSHLPDICIISPVFYQNRPLALVANLAHHVDVGGSVPGSMSTTATEIFQEGLRIPPVKIRKRGNLQEELLEVLALNVRTGREFRGDIQAQLTANDAGVCRLQELANRYGVSTLQFYMEEIMNYTERRMFVALDVIPEGSYFFEDFLEGDGVAEDVLNICVKITRNEEGLTVDFSGTHPQVSGPVNATRGVTLACVYYTVKAVIDPELPSNDGLARPIKVITPPGTLVNPAFPAPVAHANINTAQRIADVLLGALAQAVPGRVTAAGTGSMSNFTIGGMNPATGGYYTYVETYGGGQGAKHTQDGMDGVHVNMTNTCNTPVEVIEQNYPLLVQSYKLVPDSGGPGKYRGGLGLLREVKILEDSVVSVSTERVRLRPWGLCGGKPGTTARAGILQEEAVGKSSIEHFFRGLPAPSSGGKFTCSVPRGSKIFLQTAGGGGFGDPLERDPEEVRQDVLEGLVSIEAAEEEYGVLFSGELVVDEQATTEKRQKLRTSKEVAI